MEYFTMSKKEHEQIIVFEQIKNGLITRVEASVRLGVSERWARQKYKRYLEDGKAGLIHKSRGRPSKNRWDPIEKTLMIELLGKEWHGFGPTFTSEKLRELKDIKVSKETVRQVMISEGIPRAERKRKSGHQQRERRPMKGLLVQLDGSPHDWFEGRGPKCTLLVFIDDATSEILWLEFVKSESNIDVMKATKNYIERHGRPHEFYVDNGGVFKVNLNNAEGDKKTQWERALSDLSIEIVHANSPQAKGRVERANQTMQDRLIKEMRLAGISTMQEANRYVQKGDFIAKHNQRFGVVPAKKGDAHRPAQLYKLEHIFCIKEERILTNDYTISFHKQILQLDVKQRTIIRPKNVITICTFLDGTKRLFIRSTELTFKEIHMRPKRQFEKNTCQQKPKKPCLNSRRWASGLAPLPAQVDNPRRVG